MGFLGVIMGLRHVSFYFCLLLLGSQAVYAVDECVRSLQRADWTSDSSASADSADSDGWVRHQINWRTLRDYFEALPSSFERAVNSASGGDTWIDFGGGRALAMRDLVLSRLPLELPLPRLVSVDYATSPDIKTGEIIHVQEKVEALASGQLGQARIATDFFGPASYTQDLTRVLEVELSHLEVGGELYVRIGHDTYFLDAMGNPISLTAYLERFSGVQLILVEENMRSTHLLRGYSPKKVFAFRRTPSPLKIPQVRFLLDRYERQMPPKRTFQLIE